MLAGIAAFEWRYATRRATFAAAVLAFALFGFVIGATGFGAQDIHVNAPYAVAYGTGFLTLTSVFLLTVLVAPALLRDGEHQMAEIVYATGVTRGPYLLGRFLGTFAAAATVFLAGMGGMVAGSLRQDAERLAAFQPIAYLFAFAVLALPSMLLVAACLFAVAALGRSTLLTYVAGVSLYIAYFVAAVFSNSPLMAQSAPVSPQEMALAALLDPFGLTAFFEQTHGWTPLERDTRAISLTGRLLANRALVLVGAGLLLALAHARFRFRLTERSRRRRDAAVQEGVAVPSAWVQATTHPGTSWGAVVSTVRLELAAVLRSWPLAVLLLLWTGVAGMETFENLRREEYGTAVLPATWLILGQLERPLLLFGLLVVVYFSGEIVWRERTARVAEIVDATPAPNGLFVASKTLALAVLVLLLVAIGCAAGLALQLVTAYRPLEPHLYLAAAWFGGAPLVIFAALAVLLHTLAPNRHVGLLAVLAAALLFPLGAGGPEHPLLRFAHGGALDYSAMNGIGPTGRRFSALMAYWAALAALFAVLAAALWRRGTLATLRPRLRALPSRLHRSSAAACGLLFLALGAFLFQQIELASGYTSLDEAREWQAGYERTWSPWRTRPAPDLEHVAAVVDLFPGERRVRARGRYRLRNAGSVALPGFITQTARDVRVHVLTVDGREPKQIDPRLRTRVFDVALGPGATAELAFDVELDRSAIAADVQHDIVSNGSLVSTATLFPTLGYRRAHEVDDPELRRRLGLGAQVPPVQAKPELATLDLLVSAPADQTIVGPGLSTESVRDGRRFTRFVTDRPGAPVALLAAARYDVARAKAGAVDVEVLVHPGHGRNVDRILEAAVRSLQGFSRRYGPYPWPTLRVAEVPASGGRFAGFALPGVVFLTEDRGFLTDLRDESRIDIVTKRTAHEVAHQWWGHMVNPMDGPGGSTIVESLARDAEYTILAERHGPQALRPAMLVELGRYLSGRMSGPEVPLTRVNDEAWLFYAKGALVMNALRDRVGSGRVDEALRALVQQAQTGPPTADDLVAHLRAVTPPEHRPWLEEAFTQSVLYDLRVAAARGTRLGNGRTRVSARVSGTRDGQPFDGPVEVAVYAEHPDRGAPAPLARVECVLRGGAADVELEVGEQPTYVVVDPRVHFLDRNVADNVRALE